MNLDRNIMEISIKVENLTKNFNDLIAVDSINFSVEKGEIFGFLGPNGAGKTTTIRMLTGMILPDSGYAEVAGLPINRNVEKLHEAIGLLTEFPGFYERLSAIQNLRYFAGFYPDIDIQKQVQKYLKEVNLWERKDDKVKTFSKGMKQRLAIVRSLLHEPKVIFLDEPTAGLDPESAQDIRKMIIKLREDGGTIFLSTHNLSEAESLCDRIAVMNTKIVATDTPEKLRNQVFRRELIIEMDSVSDNLIENIRKLDFVSSIRQDRNRLIVYIDDIEKNRPVLIKNIVEVGGMIQSVFEEKHSLEEVYLSLVHKEDIAQ
ncbi:TPA: ABC transporter ATP-binding protein [bacterium]|nr:ABC transporter ATP-binding protein [bacterium]